MDRVANAYSRSALRFSDVNDPKRYKWHGYEKSECDAMWAAIAGCVAEAAIVAAEGKPFTCLSLVAAAGTLQQQ